jgi:hypothetical protein
VASFTQPHEGTGPRGSAAHFCVGRRSLGGTADQASLGSESNRRATQGTVKPAANFPPRGHQFEKEAKAHGVSTRGRQIDKEAGAHDVHGSGVESEGDSAPFE